MLKQLFILICIVPAACRTPSIDPELERCRQQAARVTIIRDRWGIPHIYGKTDADAVFGLMYAQCEESFEKVERSYAAQFGRLAETDGEARLYNDLAMRLICDSTSAKSDYRRSPPWLRSLLQAWADGINYYLYQHPAVRPAFFSRFEPWFPLMFTDGGYTAIQNGGLDEQDIRNLYRLPAAAMAPQGHTPGIPQSGMSGSNGFAIAPSRTAGGHALLYINPHVSFYFRTEMHMVSEEGLNAYGAVTWGQFFVFQGFNEHLGWMHTSSMADAADLYAEKVVRQKDWFYYLYEGRLRKVDTSIQVLRYKKGGQLLPFPFTAYATHHGPVMGARKGMWLSLRAYNRSLTGLIQSWQRTKASRFEAFRTAMQLMGNSSTNTVYADDAGRIAYWHGNAIPVRDTGYNWSLPVNGTVAATEWKGMHRLDEIVHVYDPPQGWIQNCNSSPFGVSGKQSIPHRYPLYMAPEGENFRSLTAMRELGKEHSFTLEKLMAIGYDHSLAAFDTLLPPLLEAYRTLPAADSLHALLQAPVAVLTSWNRRSAVSSMATTLAIEWAYNLFAKAASEPVNQQDDQPALFSSMVRNTPPQQRLALLLMSVRNLEKLHGTWKVPWGTVNRFQRIAGKNGFDDNRESAPSGMASALFGSLPAFEAVWTNSGKAYGVAGNSFVAAVEFGKKIRARAVVAGGQSPDPASKHFLDQVSPYLEGRFREVLFYREDVEKAAERTYHPGSGK